MATEKSQGTIPLADMREKPSHSPVVSRKDPSETKKKIRPEDHPLPEQDANEAEKLGFTTVDKADALPAGFIPARRNTISPPVKDQPPIIREEPQEMEARGRKRSKSKSANDYDKDSFTSRQDSVYVDPDGDSDTESRMRRYIENLHRKISILNTEKQIAEDRAERAAERISEMKQLMNSNMTEIDRETEVITKDVEELRKENKFLKEQLNDAQSHIFSLQPYRKDLTPEEVGREYDGLVELVQDWVQKLMEPYLDDLSEGITEIMTAARKRNSDAIRFKKTMRQYPDLVHAAQHPEMDEDIIVAIIMRFLHDQIFQKILYGEISQYTEMISFLENSMQSVVQPKRDLFSVRTWTAEAYNALISAREFKSLRSRRRQDLTVELATILKIFCRKDQYSWFCTNLDKNCIQPAMELYEKMQVSTHHFYLDINPYIAWGHGGDFTISPEFIDSLDKLDCKNILQNRKAFSLAKLDPAPSKKELYHRMLNICTVVPALFMRQIGQKDAIKEPTIVRKQQMLVAWGPEDKKQKFVEEGERPIVAHLYFTKADRPAEGWAPFRWG